MKLYRINDIKTSVGTILTTQEFKVIKVTSLGYWIEIHDSKRKWVSAISRKRFAYPTKEQARESFIWRKVRQIEHAKRMLENARSAFYALPDKTEKEIEFYDTNANKITLF